VIFVLVHPVATPHPPPAHEWILLSNHKPVPLPRLTTHRFLKYRFAALLETVTMHLQTPGILFVCVITCLQGACGVSFGNNVK
jgi:hypothetical protein